MNDAPTARSRYNHTAWFYEPLAALYSCCKIRASKFYQIDYMRPGQKVLYAGVGCGEDAIEAARRGMDVTCIDLSSGMLARVEKKRRRAGVALELICGDLMEHTRLGQYDVVCANYFLNVFTPEVMETVLRHLRGLLKPGGRLMIADFAAPQGGLPFRAALVLYYRIANVFYWLLSRSNLHPIYDYAKLVPRFGFQVEKLALHPLFPGGPRFFQTLITRQTG